MSDDQQQQPTNGNGNGTNGKSEVFGLVERWPMASAAAQYLRVKPQVISSMVQKGQLHPELDGKGFRRYNPAELESFAPEETDDTTESRTVAELTKLVTVLTATNAEQARLLQQVPANSQRTIDALLVMNERKDTRITALEAERVQMLDVFGEFMRGREEQKLAQLQAERSEARKDSALHAVTEHGPRLVQDLILGADLRRLFESMDPRKIEALLDLPEMLTAEEREVFQKVHERMVATQAAIKAKVESRGAVKDKPPKIDPVPGKDDVPVETQGVETRAGEGA